MVTSEPDECEKGKVRQVLFSRKRPQLAAGHEKAHEQYVRDSESEERQGDPRHVDERLFDGNERESPEEDLKHHRRMHGPETP
jgi:hypothetical protein